MLLSQLFSTNDKLFHGKYKFNNEHSNKGKTVSWNTRLVLGNAYAGTLINLPTFARIFIDQTPIFCV